MGNIGPSFGNPGFNRPQSTLPSVTPELPVVTPAELPTASLPPAGSAGNMLNNVQTAAGLAALLASEGIMTPAQMVALLRNLLQLPRELVQLMAMLANLEDNPTQTLLQALLKEEIQIPLEELQQLLQAQGQKAQEKLLKLIQNTSMGLGSSAQTAQLGELLQALSRLSEKSSSAAGLNPLQSLHTTISLYLPYFPLQAPQQFSFQYQPEEDSGPSSGGKQAAALTVFLQTLHLGPLKAVIQTNDSQALDIVLEHHLTDSELAEILQQNLQQSLQSEGFASTNLMFYSAQSVKSVAAQVQNLPGNASTETNQKAQSQQEVRLLPGQGVSARMILAAYILIRAVFELDSQEPAGS